MPDRHPAPLVFLDTETTGLTLDDDIWEFAGIRRDPDGTEHGLHLFIRHDQYKCARLPAAFLDDHMNRWPTDNPSQIVTRGDAVAKIYHLLAPDPTHGKVHIVGAVPNFDTERLTLLFERHDRAWPAHYHLIDVENLAVGYLAHADDTLAPPWNSDDLSRALGITPTTDERHTAMGDARWAQAIYDHIMAT